MLLAAEEEVQAGGAGEFLPVEDAVSVGEDGDFF
jgi:hypothetical protein